MFMTRLNLILLPSVLALALPGSAAAGTKGRPLNLSLPRDYVQTPASRQGDDTVERNLRAPAAPPGGERAPERPAPLPYGAGYEQRHQEFGGTGAGAGAGGSAGSGGAGRR